MLRSESLRSKTSLVSCLPWQAHNPTCPVIGALLSAGTSSMQEAHALLACTERLQEQRLACTQHLQEHGHLSSCNGLLRVLSPVDLRMLLLLCDTPCMQSELFEGTGNTQHTHTHTPKAHARTSAQIEHMLFGGLAHAGPIPAGPAAHGPAQ